MPPESNRVSPTLRKKVAQRANHLCEYCLCPDEFSPDSFTVDHIRPSVLGGRSISKNLAWACFGCNGRKHSKVTAIDLQTGEVVALFNPRQQDWGVHFEWSDSNTTYLRGKTPCGRATTQGKRILNSCQRKKQASSVLAAKK